MHGHHVGPSSMFAWQMRTVHYLLVLFYYTFIWLLSNLFHPMHNQFGHFRYLKTDKCQHWKKEHVSVTSITSFRNIEENCSMFSSISSLCKFVQKGGWKQCLPYFCVEQGHVCECQPEHNYDFMLTSWTNFVRVRMV